jgi:hypothetical protein
MSQSILSSDTRAAKKQVKKAIGPRLRIVFYVVLTLLAAIGANSVYLAGITFLEYWTSQTYQDYFYQCMFLLHVILGVLIVSPFLIFCVIHMRNTKDRKIRRTVMIGYGLFAVCLVVLISGFLLLRNVVDLKNPVVRSGIYWLHVGGPGAGHLAFGAGPGGAATGPDRAPTATDPGEPPGAARGPEAAAATEPRAREIAAATSRHGLDDDETHRPSRDQGQPGCH